MFKAKLEQLLSAIAHDMTGNQGSKIYTQQIHNFVWRRQSNSELAKSYLLSKENVKIEDICFTVDVYKFNDQELNKKYSKLLEFNSTSAKSKQQLEWSPI